MNMVYGQDVGAKYGTIIDGRRMELTNMNLSEEQVSAQIGDFAREVKYMKRSDFNEMYELYRNMTARKVGTRRIK